MKKNDDIVDEIISRLEEALKSFDMSNNIRIDDTDFKTIVQAIMYGERKDIYLLADLLYKSKTSINQIIENANQELKGKNQLEEIRNVKVIKEYLNHYHFTLPKWYSTILYKLSERDPEAIRRYNYANEGSGRARNDANYIMEEIKEKITVVREDKKEETSKFEEFLSETPSVLKTMARTMLDPDTVGIPREDLMNFVKALEFAEGTDMVLLADLLFEEEINKVIKQYNKNKKRKMKLNKINNIKDFRKQYIKSMNEFQRDLLIKLNSREAKAMKVHELAHKLSGRDEINKEKIMERITKTIDLALSELE